MIPIGAVVFTGAWKCVIIKHIFQSCCHFYIWGESDNNGCHLAKDDNVFVCLILFLHLAGLGQLFQNQESFLPKIGSFGHNVKRAISLWCGTKQNAICSGKVLIYKSSVYIYERCSRQRGLLLKLLWLYPTQSMSIKSCVTDPIVLRPKSLLCMTPRFTLFSVLCFTLLC